VSDIPGYTEAVEAAAKAIYNNGWDDDTPDSGYEWENADTVYDEQEPGTEGSTQRTYRHVAGTALAAAVPFLERALRDREDDPMVGFALRLDREQWGVVIDALIEHRASATRRKAGNSASTSDVRADMCADLIGQINAAAARVARGGEATE
jgi:hypothetical protein